MPRLIDADALMKRLKNEERKLMKGGDGEKYIALGIASACGIVYFLDKIEADKAYPKAYHKKHTHKTNRDVLAEMSNEELAGFLQKFPTCDCCLKNHDGACEGGSCVDGISEWLAKEVEE